MDWQLFGTILIQVVLAALIFGVLSIPIGFGIFNIRSGFKKKNFNDTNVFHGASDDGN